MRHNLRLLIIDGGGRGHALYEAAKRSSRVRRVLCTPGNGGIPLQDRRTVRDDDFDGLVALAKEEQIDLVVVGPEGPLVAGLVDRLTSEGLASFGPTGQAARHEKSKLYTKTNCRRWNIPTADFRVASSYKEAERLIKRTGFWVVKDDGLRAGKGVTVAESEAEALDAARKLFADVKQRTSAKNILVEERLEGVEISIMDLCDGIHATPFCPSRDNKRAYDGDRKPNPNTGGMGSYAPLSDVSDAVLAEIRERITLPTLRGMATMGTPFHGLLYGGIMLTKEGPRLLEYNVRFGDPETQSVLALLDSDIVPYLFATLEKGGLSKLPPLQFKPGAAVCTVLVSEGYPDEYETGFAITGIEEAQREALIFHAGTERTPELVTSSGRVMNCVGFGETQKIARERSQRAAKLIAFKGKRYRKSIANDL